MTGPYHLTEDEIRFFDEHGYLILRNRIPQPLVRRLQDAAERWIERGHHLAEGDPAGADYKFADRPSGRVMFRVDYLHGKGESASLELLGCPQMLGVAESLAGPNFVPTYESLVFKGEGDGAPIRWHQDAVHPRNRRIFNVDVYLDDSVRGEGALRVVPGSQRERADTCALEEAHGWDAPGVVHAEMAPGDVLVHDTMIVHGSEPVEGNRLRRTIYYEFRAAEQILSEGPWDRDWVDRRLRLVPLGLRHAADASPDEEPFTWNAATELRPEPVGDEAAELRVAHVVHSPSAFCSAGDVPAASGT